MKSKIKLAIPDHPRTKALIDGKVEIEGYDLEITHHFAGRAGERHHRFVEGEFDVSEFSAATYLRTKEQGFRFSAMPIFFERGPRQRNIFCCEGRITNPSELKNKRVGCQHYGATAVVWARGFLLDEYGLKTTDMDWFAFGREIHLGVELPVKEKEILGEDPYVYELGKIEQRTLETLMRYQIEQGLMRKQLPVQSLFCP